jgi:hypothetical protein
MAYTVPPVSPELMIKANNVVSENHGSGRDPMISIIAALSKKYPPKELTNTIMRLQALSELMLKDNKDNAWVMTVAEKEHVLMNEAMFRAAARAPLKEKRKKLEFNREEFLKIALEESDVDGSA